MEVVVVVVVMVVVVMVMVVMVMVNTSITRVREMGPAKAKAMKNSTLQIWMILTLASGQKTSSLPRDKFEKCIEYL